MNFPVKTALTLLTLVVLAVVPVYLPQYKNYEMLDWSGVQQVAEFKPKLQTAAPLEEEQLQQRPERALSVKRAVEPLVDAKESLAPFFEALQKVERQEDKAIVRIAHYGDSPTTADLITADVRTLLQKQFGDAGHGFYLIDRPWAWYGHRGVESNASGWDIDASNLVRNRDGFYGYGGVAFRGNAGASARYRLAGAGWSSVEVAFQKKPGAGTIHLTACGAELGEVPTASEEDGEAFAEFPIAEDCKQIDLAVTQGAVKLYGIQFRKAGPGVIYDSLGLNGAYISVLARFVGEKHWAAELQHYNPDLVIINYGTNESVYAAFVDKVFEKELRMAITRIKAALPGKSILVMSPMDRGERGASGNIETVSALARLVGLEQKIAADEGVAFFNTFEAMGGPGTMGKWYSAEPRLVGADFIHPMPGGAKIVGNLLYKAVLDSYNHYKTKKLQSSLP